MTCIPKHIACEWYNPEIDSGFIAGPEGCTLTSINEVKARLLIGGTFFRSKNVGIGTNGITVSCVWQVFDVTWINYDSGIHTAADIGRVQLTLSDGVTPEIYYQTQTFTAGNPEDVWVSAIGGLRTQLTTSQLVNMPTDDVPTSWIYTNTPPTGDDDHIAEFSSSNLSGGDGADESSAGLAAIRTGPAMTLVYIQNSELNTENADPDDPSIVLGEVRFWNGACWKLFDSTNPDCAPNGTLPTDPICTIGPTSDC